MKTSPRRLGLLARGSLTLLACAGLAQVASAFTHPGLLHKQSDFDRIKSKVQAGAHPWIDAWNVLCANSHAQTTYTPNAQAVICRGGACPGMGYSENYMILANDAHAAYQCAIRWKISGDNAYASKAVQIMNAWSSTLTQITGDSNALLAAGLYGYEFAQAGELLRSYSGWKSADFTKFKTMLLTKFYPICSDFLVRHNGTCISHYWANWDACAMDCILATAILCDDQTKFDEALHYFYSGAGNGSYRYFTPFVYSDGLAQSQEAGRDQGHCTLNVALFGAFCQMANNQGRNLFIYNPWKETWPRAKGMFEYVAKYNLGYDVAYTAYNNCDNVNQTVIAEGGRGTIRPNWELVYNYYAKVRGESVPYMKQFAMKVRPEGGGGDYGSTSGGYDQLGFGTLLYTLDPVTPGPIADGTYKIVARHSGKALDVSGGSNANGANVQQWTYNGYANQQWKVTNLGDGVYSIVGVASGKALDVTGGSTADGANMEIWPYLKQTYIVTATDSGYYRITPAFSDKCIDVSGAGTGDGANVIQWTYTGATNQQWAFQTP
jgi:hypothetical protein